MNHVPGVEELVDVNLGKTIAFGGHTDAIEGVGGLVVMEGVGRAVFGDVGPEVIIVLPLPGFGGVVLKVEVLDEEIGIIGFFDRGQLAHEADAVAPRLLENDFEVFDVKVIEDVVIDGNELGVLSEFAEGHDADLLGVVGELDLMAPKFAIVIAKADEGRGVLA